MSDGQPTTQSKYRKRKKSEIQPIIDANEVRIKGNQGHVKRYVDYACSLLEGRRVINLQEDEHGNVQTPDSKQEDEASSEPTKFDTIVLKATGRAINKAVTTAEVVKRRIADLHQITALDTLEITDEWEPLEQGLKVVETKRRVASITITLSRDEESLKAHQDYSTGYQVPICSDNIKPYIMQQTRPSPRRNRGGGYGRRGGRGRRDNRDNGRRNDRMDNRDEDNYDRPRRGRGGRGPRGGGYGGRGPGGGYDRPRGGGGGYGGGRGGGYGGGPRGGRYGGGGGTRDSGGRFDRDREDRMSYGGRRGRGSPRGPRGYGGPPRGRGRGPSSRYDDSGY